MNVTTMSVGARGRRRSLVLAAILSVVLAGLPGLTDWAFAAESANLDQCANGAFGSPREACTWVNGNLNQSSSQYREGDSVAYRAVLGDLTPGDTYQITLGWDTINGGHAALDYLTSWDCSESGAPQAGAASTFAIPNDPRITLAGITDQTGNCATSVFSIWDGTITAVSPYGYQTGTAADLLPTSGSMQSTVTITFVPSSATPTLAWGGHIANRNDWAQGSAVESTGGSPFHMRFVGDLVNVTAVTTKNLGNQDRSLKAVPPQPEFTFTKSASPSTVAPGGSFDYVLTVTNVGNDPADAFTVTDDSIDPALTVTGVEPAANCSATGNDVSCSFTSLAVGASQVVTITTLAPTTAGICGTYDNTAEFSHYHETTRTQTDLTADAQVTVDGCGPILTIDKTASSATVDLGKQVTWTLTATNSAAATGDATGVVITDTVDAAFTVASVTPSAGSCSSTTNDVSCEVGDLAPGESATVTIVATEVGNACTTVGNTGYADATNHAQVSDSAPVNVQGCGPILTVTKTGASSTIGLGGLYSWTIEVENDASATAAATNVVVTDTVDGAFTVTKVTPSAGSCSSTTNDVSCEVGDLATGASATVTIEATATSAADACADVFNQASAIADNHGNVDSSSVKTTITGCTADLSVTKSASSGTVPLGGEVTWTVTASSDGTATATTTNVVVTDTVDAAFTVTKVTTSAGSCSSTTNDVLCEVGDLAPGGSATVEITATATDKANACQVVDNQAFAVADNHGQVSSDVIEVEIVGCWPELSVHKTTSTPTVGPGQQAAFAIQVDNDGKGDAEDVVVDDVVPAGWTLDGLTSAAGTCDVGAASCTVDVLAESSAIIAVTMTAPTGTNACTQYTNVAQLWQGEEEAKAVVDVVGCPGTPPPPPAPPSISLVKSGSTTSAGLGDVVDYTYTITNTGTVVLVDVTLADVVSSGAGTADLDLVGLLDGITLAPGASFVTTSSWTVTEADLPGPLNNVATATGRNGTRSVQATDDWSVGLDSNPAIEVVKSADQFDVVFASGFEQVVTYTYVVTNTGDVTLTDVTLEDDVLGSITLATTTLGPGVSTVATAVHVVTQADADAGQITNVATATGTPPVGGPVSGTDEVTVPVSQAEVLGETIERPDPAPAPEVAPQVEELPATGNEFARPGAVAVWLLAAGALLLAAAPRRRWQQ